MDAAKQGRLRKLLDQLHGEPPEGEDPGDHEFRGPPAPKPAPQEEADDFGVTDPIPMASKKPKKKPLPYV